MRVLLTRPLEDSRAVAGALRPDGVDCLIWPLTQIVPAARALEIPAGTGGLLFTSANGVRAFATLQGRRDLPAFCVGDATAQAARTLGFADVHSAGGDMRALAEMARRTGIRAFLHARGRHAAGDLAGLMARADRRVTAAVLYEAVEGGPPPPPVAAALAGGSVDLVTLWSRRGASFLARHLAGIEAELGSTDLLAISPAAAAPLATAGFRRSLIAETPSGEAMRAAIRAAARARK